MTKRHRAVNSDSRGDASRQYAAKGSRQGPSDAKAGASRQKRASTVAKRPAPITWQTAYCEATRVGWLFVLPVPMSANKSHRRGRYRQYTPEQHRTDKAAALLKFGPHAQLTGDVVVRIGWVRERKSGDTDNRKKTTLDILKGVAYADDKQVADARIVRFDDPTLAPGVYVWVEPWQPLRLHDLAA